MRRLATAMVILACAALEAQAQVRGLPVSPDAMGAGRRIRAEVGLPGNALGGGSTIGLTAVWRGGIVGLSATVARVAPSDTPAGLGAGVIGRLAVLRAATSPFRAGVFIGTAILRRETPARDRTVDEGRVPLGADFAFVLPTPIVTLAPWVAPRIQYTGGSGPTAAARGTHAAFATGVELELPNGLGFRLAYDRVLLTGDDEATFGIGLSYSFQPGL